MKEMRVASIAFAAYLRQLGARDVHQMIGSPVRMNGA